MSRGARTPLVHLVGSVPLPDAESVFRSVSQAVGHRLARLPDGETGIRQSWIRFLQDALAEHPAIEPAPGVAPFRFVQWDGKLVREIAQLRIRPGATVHSDAFHSGYAEMALESWQSFARLQRDGIVGQDVKFQISLPTPIAPTYNNMIPADRPRVIAALTRHFVGEVQSIAANLPPERIAIQWDVCQEVLAWEGYYAPGPVDFRTETLAVLTDVGNAVPAGIELGYHLCYGSPLDEHIVQPRDTAIMVDMASAVAAQVGRRIDYFHFPVPKTRTDSEYFAPLERLWIDPATQCYFGLIHPDDGDGNAARLAMARRYARVDGVAAECGMGRGDASRLSEFLRAHLVALGEA